MNTSLILLACLLGIAVAQYTGGYDGGYDGGYGGGGPGACMPVSGEMNGKIVVPGKVSVYNPKYRENATDASACAEDCRDMNDGSVHAFCEAWSFDTVAKIYNCI